MPFQAIFLTGFPVWHQIIRWTDNHFTVPSGKHFDTFGTTLTNINTDEFDYSLTVFLGAMGRAYYQYLLVHSQSGIPDLLSLEQAKCLSHIAMGYSKRSIALVSGNASATRPRFRILRLHPSLDDVVKSSRVTVWLQALASLHHWRS